MKKNKRMECKDGQLNYFSMRSAELLPNTLRCFDTFLILPKSVNKDLYTNTQNCHFT